MEHNFLSVASNITTSALDFIHSLCINWSQFIPELIATIFGFGLAIWGERIVDRIKANNDAVIIRGLLKDELKKIISDLKKFDETSLDVQPLKIPSWESAIHTGQIALLDSRMREKLFKVYNAIKEFNAWCSIHTNYYFEKGQQNELLIKELNKIKTELLEDDCGSNFVNINAIVSILEEKVGK